MTQPPTLKYGKLACTSLGFTFSTHRRSAPAEISRALGYTTHNPKSRIAKRQRKRTYPKGWWEAQVRLYGLDSRCNKWTIEGMKQTLIDAIERCPLKVPEDLIAAEDKLKWEWEQINAEFQRTAIQKAERERNEKYESLNEDVEKANYDAERFLTELKETGRIKALRGLRSHGEFRQTAERLGLLARTTNGVSGNYNDRITIVSTDSAAVYKKIDRIDDLVQQQKEQNRQSRESHFDKKHQELLAHGGGYNTIAGVWHLTIPEMSRNRDEDIFWQFTVPDKSKSKVIWVSFDLLILAGIIRIPIPKHWKERELNFTWRGREVYDEFGNGEIQFDDDENTGKITFTSETTCCGMFISAYGDYKFTGKKISEEVDIEDGDLEREYEDYDQDDGMEDSDSEYF